MSSADVNNASTGIRVRQTRKAVGLSQDKFAKTLGLSRSYISKVEDGKAAITKPTAIAIERKFGVRANWLLYGGTRMSIADKLLPGQTAAAGDVDDEIEFVVGNAVPAIDLPIPEVRFPVSFEKPPDGVRTAEYLAVPLVSDPIAAGAALIASDIVEEYAWIHRSQIGKRKNLVAVRVDGDSMRPILRDGDIVAIDRDDRHLPGIFACRVDGGATIKWAKAIGKQILLTPENREFDEMLLAPRSLEDVLIGRVVWQWSDLVALQK